MVTQELLDYISAQLGQGTPKDAITANLAASGWQAADIESGFATATGVPGEPAPQPAGEIPVATVNTDVIRPGKLEPAKIIRPPAMTPDQVAAAQREWVTRNRPADDTDTVIPESVQPPPDRTAVQTGQPDQTYTANTVVPEKKGGGKTCLIIILVAGGLGCIIVALVLFFGTALLVAVNPASQFEKARTAANRSNYQLIKDGLEQYYISNNSYPATLDELVSTDIIPKLPLDPETQTSYRYELLSGGNDYQLCSAAKATRMICMSKISNVPDLFATPAAAE